MVAAHYKKCDLVNCWASSSDISGYHADFHEGHVTVGAEQGSGMSAAWARHAMCESAFIYPSQLRNSSSVHLFIFSYRRLLFPQRSADNQFYLLFLQNKCCLCLRHTATEIQQRLSWLKSPIVPLNCSYKAPETHPWGADEVAGLQLTPPLPN